MPILNLSQRDVAATVNTQKQRCDSEDLDDFVAASDRLKSNRFRRSDNAYTWRRRKSRCDQSRGTDVATCHIVSDDPKEAIIVSIMHKSRNLVHD